MNAINAYFIDLQQTLSKVNLDEIEHAHDVFCQTIIAGSKILFIGNGGSAANALHFANDLNNTFATFAETKFKALALTENIATILSIANDISFDQIFVVQLKIHLQDNDTLVCLSTSGVSINVVKACLYAKSTFNNIKIISFTGYDSGELKKYSDVIINAPISDTQISEDIQLIAFHAIWKKLLVSLNK